MSTTIVDACLGPADVFRAEIARVFAPVAGVSEGHMMSMVDDAPFEKGDYAVAVARINRFRKLKARPADVAAEWAAAAEIPTDSAIESVTADGPFVNVRLRRATFLPTVVRAIIAAGDAYGCSDEGRGKRVVVEFSSPNIAKPFHAGHLRSTILGNFLSNVHRALGYEVTAINYLGDWGKQYGLLAVGFERYGSEEELQDNPIRHLFDVYVRVNVDAKAEKEADGAQETEERARAYFRRMEDGDADALALWRRFRELSITDYKRQYERLNVHFDEFSGESEFSEEMVAELQRLRERGVLEESDGALVVRFADHGAKELGVVPVRKSDGATLYITRDIAAAHWRFQTYAFDRMFYVVAAQQDLHFRRLFKILELAGYDEFAGRCTHVNFGMVKGMSTRKGDVIFLDDILAEARERMLERMRRNDDKFSEVVDPEGTADIVGVSAVMVQDFNARRIKDYPFVWDSVLAAEGDTGVYLQYTHARLASLLRKASAAGVDLDASCALDQLLYDDVAMRITQRASRFPVVLASSAAQQEPCIIVNYLFDLCHDISFALTSLRVIGAEPDVSKARLALFKAAHVTLRCALVVLGIRPLERM
jgi:arginyl-tRNA synthetase